jgi:hypothetical protein
MAWRRPAFAAGPTSTAALVVAALFVAVACSCGPTIQCPCPAAGHTVVTLPATAPSSAIMNVSTDAPCTATDAGSDRVAVLRQSAGTCQVRVQLESGDRYDFSVQFGAVGGGCCEGLIGPVDASVPQLVDAGAGG